MGCVYITIKICDNEQTNINGQTSNHIFWRRSFTLLRNDVTTQRHLNVIWQLFATN